MDHRRLFAQANRAQVTERASPLEMIGPILHSALLHLTISCNINSMLTSLHCRQARDNTLFAKILYSATLEHPECSMSRAEQAQAAYIIGVSQLYFGKHNDAVKAFERAVKAAPMKGNKMVFCGYHFLL